MNILQERTEAAQKHRSGSQLSDCSEAESRARAPMTRPGTTRIRNEDLAQDEMLAFRIRLPKTHLGKRTRDRTERRITRCAEQPAVARGTCVCGLVRAANKI